MCMCKCVGGMYVICPKKINFVIFMQFLGHFSQIVPKGCKTWNLLLPLILFTVCTFLIFISTGCTQARMSVCKTVSEAQFPKL